MRWSERLFDPLADAAGPPPERLGAFMRWLMRGAEPAVWWLAVVSALLGLAEVVGAALIGWVIDRAAQGPEGFWQGEAWALLGAALFFLALKPALMAISTALTSLSIGPGLFTLGVWRLQGHTLGQSLGFFEDDFTGRLAQKQVQTANALTDTVSEFFNSIGFALATVVGAIVALAGADLWLGLVLAAWLAVYAWLIRRNLPRIRELSRIRAEARARLSGQLVDSLSHMATVKLFAHAGHEAEAARRALAAYREAALDFGRRVTAFRTWLGFLAGVLPVALIGVSLVLWSEGTVGPGAIALAGFLATRLGQMSGWVSFTAMGIFANVGTVEDGMQTLARPHGLTDRPGATPAPGGGAGRGGARGADGRIAYEAVSFRYGRQGGGGLDRFSLTIEPGERVALVGPSGAGKSTALALLLRLYDVEGGRVTLDGQDVRDWPQDALRGRIAMVTQETAMFNRSALDNIRMGRPGASRDEVIAAATQAAADGFVRGLRDHRGRTGYDAHLGERGVKLSGGQRQRIALARAILKDAPVLALDEATSALDSETEAEVQEALTRAMAGRTVIAIAHRLSTIAAMDRIVVMDRGRIVEEGAHGDLIRRQGLYARLWQRQSGGFLGLAAE